MTGIEFYEFLRDKYKQNGQPLYGNFSFCDWLYKHENETYSFRFNIPNNGPKAIPKNIIIAAWDTNQNIDDNWISQKFDLSFHNDCRLHILNFLLNEYKYFRQAGSPNGDPAHA